MTMPPAAQLVLKCGASRLQPRASASFAILAMMGTLICTEASAQLPVPACTLPRLQRSTAWGFLQTGGEHFSSNVIDNQSHADRLITKFGAADRLRTDAPVDAVLPSSLASTDVRSSASSIAQQIVFSANQTRTASATTSSSINGSIYLLTSDSATEGRSIAPETTARQ